jgi:hypothetical protein
MILAGNSQRLLKITNTYKIIVEKFKKKSTIVLLDFVHPPNYKTINSQRFKIWITLSSSGKRGIRAQKNSLLDPLVEIASGIGGDVPDGGGSKNL